MHELDAAIDRRETAIASLDMILAELDELLDPGKVEYFIRRRALHVNSQAVMFAMKEGN